MGQSLYKQACTLLPLTSCTLESGIEANVPRSCDDFQRLCDTAEVYYNHSVALFDAVHDAINLSAVLCNASSLKRLRGMNGTQLREMLQQAITLCHRAHAALEERTNNMWDRVNQEAANCYLTLGMLVECCSLILWRRFALR